tara:strand:- start:1159 stop:1740 length:582 start_codon:yes stop_codon:yes gene_type:complete
MKKLLLLSALLIFAFDSNCQNPEFYLNKSFVQITSDYWNKKAYKDDFKKGLDETDVLNLKLQEIELISNDLFSNKDILFYVKNDVSAIVTIEKSKLPYEGLTSNQDFQRELCNYNKKMSEDMGELMYYYCGTKKINDYLYFVTEMKSKTDLDLNYDWYEWSNQYWREIKGTTYHIAINSNDGLSIQDVLIKIE